MTTIVECWKLDDIANLIDVETMVQKDTDVHQKGLGQETFSIAEPAFPHLRELSITYRWLGK